MRFSFARQAVLSFGTVLAIGGMSSPVLAADGKAVYDRTCALCHAAGVANAPKFGDKEAWTPRAAIGKPALVASVIKGKGAMPPRAGAADLKDDDLQAAVDYMLSAAK